VELLGKKIVDLDPEALCPPESKGEVQELLLQILCVLFALGTAAIMAKLACDYWRYRTKGQLPWMALHMKVPF